MPLVVHSSSAKQVEAECCTYIRAGTFSREVEGPTGCTQAVDQLLWDRVATEARVSDTDLVSLDDVLRGRDEYAPGLLRINRHPAKSERTRSSRWNGRAELKVEQDFGWRILLDATDAGSSA